MRPLPRQRGIVSLLTTVIISTLLLIITTSMAALMSGELRQATDSDQSTKAYFAAESGVEDALQRIKPLIKSGAAITNDGTCIQPTLASTAVQDSLGVSVTCQRIVELTSSLTGKVERDEAREIELIARGGMNRIELYWNIDPRYAPGSEGDARNLAAPSNFPAGAGWQYPAVMEVIIAAYKADGGATIGPGDIEPLQTMTIRPGTNGNPTGNIGDNVVQTANCTTPPTANTYNCYFRMDGFNGGRNNYVIRLKARYAGTHFKMVPLTGNNAITVPDNYITVDVTAKSGNVYRRVIRKVPRRAGLVSGLEYVIFGDGEVCKSSKESGTGVITGCPIFP